MDGTSGLVRHISPTRWNFSIEEIPPCLIHVGLTVCANPLFFHLVCVIGPRGQWMVQKAHMTSLSNEMELDADSF